MLNWLIIILASLSEVLALWSTISKNSFEAFIQYHLVSSFLMASLVAMKISSIKMRNLNLYLLALWICLPTIGWLLVAPLFWKLKDSERLAQERAETTLSSADAEDESFNQLSLERKQEFSVAKIKPLSALASRPFIDILVSEDVDAKKKVISKLRADKSWEAVRLLKLAQKDSLYDIQYLATVALSAIETDWNLKLKNLNQEIELAPQDKELRNEIVQTYMRIYGSQLLPIGVCKIYLNNTREHLTVSLSLDSNQPELLIIQGKIYLFFEEYKEAKAAFDLALSLQPENVIFRIWRAEALYLLHDYEKLATEFKDLSQRNDVPEKLKDSILYWSSRAA